MIPLIEMGTAPPELSRRRILRHGLASAFVLLLITLLFAAPVSADNVWDGSTIDTTWDGAGTEANPYLITSAAELAGLASQVNAGTYYTGKYFKLTDDINLNNKNWVPIGNKSIIITDGHSFQGTFDGGGHTISGLNVTQGNNGCFGLFGCNEGVIKNLNVAGSISFERISARSYAGGIAGYNLGTISNCSSSVTINVKFTSSNSSGGYYVGGIAGFNLGTISNSYATGDVTANAICNNNIQVYVGGVAGANNCKISNSYATGDVTATSTSGDVRAGGITGHNTIGNDALISNCYATGDVTATSTSGDVRAGGIAGYSYTYTDKNVEISNCYATGDVTATSTSGEAYAGGIAGYVEGSNSGTSTVSDSYALNAKISSSKYAGRVVGNNTKGTVENNMGWEKTTLNNAPAANGEINGENVASSAVWEQLFGQFTPENGWTLSSNANFRLPVLANLPEPADASAPQLDPDVRTVTFNANNDSAEWSVKVADGGTVGEPANPTKTGYTFDRWYNDTALTDAWEFTSDTATADITLYAKWTANTYTVTFDANGGEGSMNPQTFTYDETAKALAANSFTREGYTADGWATSAGGAKVYENEEPVQNLTAEPNGTFPLFANWTPNTYTVKFHNNTGTGDMADQTFTYDAAQTLTANTFTNLGHTFDGWATSENGEVVYSDGASVLNLTTVKDGIVNLYAKWRPDGSWKVTFESNGGSAVPSEYISAGGTVTKPTDPTKTGHTFNGWYNDSALTDAWDFSSDTVTADIILYAKWNANPAPSTGGGGGSGSHAPVTTTYTVTFDANGGVGIMNPQTFISGKETELSANTFTREGFVFMGWAESADGDAVYVDGETVLVKKSQTLYAVWTELNPTVTPTDEPSEEPTGEPIPTEPGKTPAPILGILLGGLAAALCLRRK